MTRPAFIQGGAHPIFRGRSQESLRCRECGAVLVEGYDPRALIAVDLECFACKTVTSTPAWPDNEPLPQHAVVTGAGSVTNVVQSIGATQRADLLMALELVKQEIARAPGLVEQDRIELAEVADDAATEVGKERPNTRRLSFYL